MKISIYNNYYITQVNYWMYTLRIATSEHSAEMVHHNFIE